MLYFTILQSLSILFHNRVVCVLLKGARVGGGIQTPGYQFPPCQFSQTSCPGWRQITSITSGLLFATNIVHAMFRVNLSTAGFITAELTNLLTSVTIVCRQLKLNLLLYTRMQLQLHLNLPRSTSNPQLTDRSSSVVE